MGAGALRISKVLEPQKISDEDEDKDGQKLFSNASNMLIGCVALLSFAAMAGVRMRRGMQPAIAVASSGGHVIDTSLPMVLVSVGNTLGLTSQGSSSRIPEQVLHGSERALAKNMHTDIKSSCALGDPLDLGETAPQAHVESFRES